VLARELDLGETALRSWVRLNRGVWLTPRFEMVDDAGLEPATPGM